MPQEGFLRVDKSGDPIIPQGWRLTDGYIPTVALDLGVHVHSIVHLLTGKIPLEAFSIMNSHGNHEGVIDDIRGFVHYSDDILVDMWFSKSAIGYRNGLKVRVFGNVGAAEWVQENPELLILSNNLGERSFVDRSNLNVEVANLSRYSRFKPGHPAGFVEAFANHYYDIGESLNQYKVGQDSVFNEYTYGARLSHEGMLLLEAMVRSSFNKKWEKI
jgi:predicted dehydrogenase